MVKGPLLVNGEVERVAAAAAATDIVYHQDICGPKQEIRVSEDKPLLKRDGYIGRQPEKPKKDDKRNSSISKINLDCKLNLLSVKLQRDNLRMFHQSEGNLPESAG
ncbi:hypothetical protein PABG_07623 [Paracoccidioides brasiliensis Pb03]|nr:hypothetical protein PABG_07623 [Paracoccidioides brasiliensis Pb03]